MVLPKARLISPTPTIYTASTLTTASPVHLMSLVTILFGILVLVLVAPSQAQPLVPSGNSNNFEYKHYCSNSLTDVLHLLCGGSSNSQQYVQYQRSSGVGTFSSNTLNRFASNDGRTYFRTDRIHECCLRPCGYSELKLYCAPV